MEQLTSYIHIGSGAQVGAYGQSSQRAVKDRGN